MQPALMPMPGALRLRTLHPVIDGDGSCSLVYDLERAAVVEVPAELQFYIAPALETGNLDEGLVGWLVSEDLLTAEGWAGWSAEGETAGSLEGGWWSLESICRVDDEVHARIDQTGSDAVSTILQAVFQQGVGAARLRLHLDWGGRFPDRALLEQVVVEASCLARLTRQEVFFELSLAASEVTPSVAGFLADLPIQVLLLCGRYPGSGTGTFAARGTAWSAEPVVRHLLSLLGDRLTVHCVLDRARLLDVWEWARRTGVRRLDAVQLEDSAVGDGLPQPARLRDYRNDLLAVCDEMANDLAAQRLPIDYKPLTRIVGRLMRCEPLDRRYGERPSLPALAPDVFFFRPNLETLEPRLRPDLWPGPDEDLDLVESGSESVPCQGCWARRVCSHSSFVASSLAGEDLREPSEERCAFWKTEAEVALRFYHRLAHTDPIQVLQLFEEASREPDSAPPGRREDLGHLKASF